MTYFKPRANLVSCLSRPGSSGSTYKTEQHLNYDRLAGRFESVSRHSWSSQVRPGHATVQSYTRTV